MAAKYQRAEILEDLKRNVMEVTFTKVDGTRRVLHGTLMPQYLPRNTDLQHLDDKHADKKNQNVIVVYDLREHGWRSFRVASVDYLQEIAQG